MKNKESVFEIIKKYVLRTSFNNTFKEIVSDYLILKTNYLYNIIDEKDEETKNKAIYLLILKYINNLEINIKEINPLKNEHHSIYAKYDSNKREIKYNINYNYLEKNMLNNLPTSKGEYEKVNFNKIKRIKEESNKKNESLTTNEKENIVEEFKVMMYSELEKAAVVTFNQGTKITNGIFVYESLDNNYLNEIYTDNYLDYLNDVFCEVEVCKMLETDLEVKVYLNKDKTNYIHAKHISKNNIEVLRYADILISIIGNTNYYKMILNPQKYTKDIIKEFNMNYSSILKSLKESKKIYYLDENNMFDTLVKYIISIKERIDIKNKMIYHNDLIIILEQLISKLLEEKRKVSK